MERNQVLFSQTTGKFYFVPVSQKLGGAGPEVRKVVGKKIDVTSSVQPLIAHTVAHHLRRLASSSVFNGPGYRRLMDAAREVEKKAGICAAGDEG
jgi:hypothetical protein